MDDTFNQLPEQQQHDLAEAGGLNFLLEFIEPLIRLFFGRLERRWTAARDLLDRPYWTRA
jgi:hypothetical protein